MLDQEDEAHKSNGGRWKASWRLKRSCSQWYSEIEYLIVVISSNYLCNHSRKLLSISTWKCMHFTVLISLSSFTFLCEGQPLHEIWERRRNRSKSSNIFSLIFLISLDLAPREKVTHNQSLSSQKSLLEILSFMHKKVLQKLLQKQLLPSLLRQKKVQRCLLSRLRGRGRKQCLKYATLHLPNWRKRKKEKHWNIKW